MSEEEIKEKKVKKPKSKARRIIEWIFTGIFLVLFGVVMAAQIDGMVNKSKHFGEQIRFGYAAFVVQTDSMEPEYKVKSAIITYLESPDKIYDRFVNKHEVVDLSFYDDPNDHTLDAFRPDDTTLYDPIHLDYDAPVRVITHRLREIHVDNSKKVGEGKYTFVCAGINVGGNMSKAGQYQAFTEKYLLGRVVVGSAFLGGVFNFVGTPFGLLVLLLIPAFYLVISSVFDIFKAYKEPDEVEEGASSNPNGVIELSEEDKKRLKEELLQEMLEKKKGGDGNESK